MPPWTRLVAPAVLALAACSEEPGPPAAAPEPEAAPVAEAPAPVTPTPRAVAAAERAPTGAPVLHRMLPADAVAYLRIPSAVATFGTPKGSIFDAAVGSAAWAEAAVAIREGFGTEVVPEIPPPYRALAALLIAHARSPIEAVVLPPGLERAPFPDVLATVALDFPDAAALGAFVNDASSRLPMLELPAPLDADGDGLLLFAGIPVPVRYRDSRLWLLASAAPDPARLDALVSALAPSDAHPMLAVEGRLDASGQGLFAWADPPRVIDLVATAGRADQAAMLTAFGAAEMRAVAIGIGTSGGIHRAKLLVEMPRVGFRAFVPAIRANVEVEAAGEPTGVALFGLPGADDLAAIEQGLVATLDAEAMTAYLEAKRELAERAGFGVEELLEAVGQDVVAMFDEAGQYVAVRIRDGARFDALLARAVERFDVELEQREIAGVTIHHATVPVPPELLEPADDAEAEVPPLTRRMLALPSHLFWLREGDYLIAAGTPQSLIDRQYVAARTPIDEWLRDRQRLEPDGALLLASARSRGLPALLHELNLRALATAGDFVGRPVDLFAFPTARELGLPEAGAYGLRIASTDAELSAELAYENNPLEVLFAGGGATGLAVVGILAAVAIPAYQDYTVKAKVHEGVAAAHTARQFLERFAADNGRFPNEAELATLDLGSLAREGVEVGILPDGRVIVLYDLPALGDANVISFVPSAGAGAIEWECVSDIAAKYLPSECRAP